MLQYGHYNTHQDKASGHAGSRNVICNNPRLIFDDIVQNDEHSEPGRKPTMRPEKTTATLKIDLPRSKIQNNLLLIHSPCLLPKLYYCLKSMPFRCKWESFWYLKKGMLIVVELYTSQLPNQVSDLTCGDEVLEAVRFDLIAAMGRGRRDALSSPFAQLVWHLSRR